MNQRLKMLRKKLDITQQEFADRLGIKRNTVATYESGKSNPSDSAVMLICREFDVNEEWLRTGNGEIFIQKSDSTLLSLAKEHNLSNADVILLEKFINMKPENRKIIQNYILETAKEITGNKEIFSAPDSEDDLDHMEPSNTTSHKVG